MEKRSSTFADMSLVISAPKPLVDSFAKKKPLIGKHFTLLQPYVCVERLDQKTLRRLLLVRRVVEDKPKSSEESAKENESESSKEIAEENESESSEKSAEENETPVKQNRTKEDAKATSEMSEYEKLIQRNI